LTIQTLPKDLELGCYPQYIYITSDEKIKELDWFLNIKSGAIGQHNGSESLLFKNYRKIILTTDQDLIKDGVQSIDDDFLEWFVKNPSCEEVEVEKEKVLVGWEPDYTYEDIGIEGSKNVYQYFYKIIPQKETKQELPQLGTKEFNNLASAYFGGKPREEPKQDLEKDIFENLKEYYKNIPREKVLKDWNKSAHLDNVGPTVEEFIENSNEERLKEAAERYESTFEEFSQGTESIDFIAGAKSDAARDYWFEKFKLEQEEDLKTAYFSGIKTTGEGWNGEYANGNNPSIEEEFQEGFQEWLRQFKNK
jgi:hypothetical protein